MPGINARKDDETDLPYKPNEGHSGTDSTGATSGSNSEFESQLHAQVPDEVVPVKVCQNPLCRQTDQTDFSTCRYCGANYDPRMRTFGREPIQRGFSLSEFAMRPFGIVIILAIGILARNLCGFFLGTAIGNTEKKATVTVQTESANLRDHPQDYQSLIRRGDAYWAKTYTQLACDDYSAAIKIDSTKPEAYDKRALMYDALGSYNLASQDRETANKLRH